MLAGLDGLRFNHWQVDQRPDGVVVLSFDRAGESVNTFGQEVLRWRLVTSFPKVLDAISGGAEKFAQSLRLMSGGQIEVSVHSAGELMPAFGVMEGVQNGVVEMALTADRVDWRAMVVEMIEQAQAQRIDQREWRGER